MNVYLDTSALVKLYVPESGSVALASYVLARAQALPFTALQELEIRNALRLKLFRREAAATEVEEALRAISVDLAAGVLVRIELDWREAFARAEELSARVASRAGVRTLDILHVAAALVLGCRQFLTFDERQAPLARDAGLRRVQPRAQPKVRGKLRVRGDLSM